MQLWELKRTREEWHHALLSLLQLQDSSSSQPAEASAESAEVKISAGASANASERAVVLQVEGSAVASAAPGDAHAKRQELLKKLEELARKSWQQYISLVRCLCDLVCSGTGALS